jgi:ketosteroid isomerase-like protein
MTTHPKEQATDAVNRTAQEILAALLAKDSSKVNSYYAADAVIATPGRPAAKDGRAVSKAIRDDTEDPNFKMSLSNEKTEVAGSGDLLYEFDGMTDLVVNAPRPGIGHAKHDKFTVLLIIGFTLSDVETRD